METTAATTATPTLAGKAEGLVRIHKDIATHKQQLKLARRQYKHAIEEVREGMKAEGVSECRVGEFFVRTADTCQLNISEA